MRFALSAALGASMRLCDYYFFQETLPLQPVDGLFQVKEVQPGLLRLLLQLHVHPTVASSLRSCSVWIPLSHKGLITAHDIAASQGTFRVVEGGEALLWTLPQLLEPAPALGHAARRRGSSSEKQYDLSLLGEVTLQPLAATAAASPTRGNSGSTFVSRYGSRPVHAVSAAAAAEQPVGVCMSVDGVGWSYACGAAGTHQLRQPGTSGSEKERTFQVCCDTASANASQQSQEEKDGKELLLRWSDTTSLVRAAAAEDRLPLAIRRVLLQEADRRATAAAALKQRSLQQEQQQWADRTGLPPRHRSRAEVSSRRGAMHLCSSSSSRHSDGGSRRRDSGSSMPYQSRAITRQAAASNSQPTTPGKKEENHFPSSASTTAREQTDVYGASYDEGEPAAAARCSPPPGARKWSLGCQQLSLESSSKTQSSRSSSSNTTDVIPLALLEGNAETGLRGMRCTFVDGVGGSSRCVEAPRRYDTTFKERTVGRGRLGQCEELLLRKGRNSYAAVVQFQLPRSTLSGCDILGEAVTVHGHALKSSRKPDARTISVKESNSSNKRAAAPGASPAAAPPCTTATGAVRTASLCSIATVSKTAATAGATPECDAGVFCGITAAREAVGTAETQDGATGVVNRTAGAGQAPARIAQAAAGSARSSTETEALALNSGSHIHQSDREDLAVSRQIESFSKEYRIPVPKKLSVGRVVLWNALGDCQLFRTHLKEN